MKAAVCFIDSPGPHSRYQLLYHPCKDVIRVQVQNPLFLWNLAENTFPNRSRIPFSFSDALKKEFWSCFVLGKVVNDGGGRGYNVCRFQKISEWFVEGSIIGFMNRMVMLEMSSVLGRHYMSWGGTPENMLFKFQKFSKKQLHSEKVIDWKFQTCEPHPLKPQMETKASFDTCLP